MIELVTDRDLSRRDWLRTAGAVAAGAVCARPEVTRSDDKKERVPQLGFSLYGMRSLALDEALTQCAAIGYRSVELPLLVGWPGDTATMNKRTKDEFRAGLAKHDLRLSALMENLPILVDDARQQTNLERLKAAAELSREWVAGQPGSEPPLVETVLGGKPAQWDETKQKIIEHLGKWIDVMADAKVPLAIKAHISNAIQTPEQLRWVLDQLKSPWLVAAYDYSHFELQKLSIDDSLRPLAGMIQFVHVKDAVGEPGKFQFVLPGEGKTDYRRLFAALGKTGYRGDIVVEVSGQIHSKAGYDPLAAAKKCYAALAPAIQAGDGAKTP